MVEAQQQGIDKKLKHGNHHQEKESKDRDSLRRKHIPKPDKVKFEEEVEAIQKEIEAQEKEAAAIKSSFDKINNSRNSNKGEVDAARSLMAQLQNQRKELTAEKNALTVQRDAARDRLTAQTNAEKNARSEIKFTSLEAIDKQIRDLETRQARTTMTLQDEKKIIKDIKALQQSKKALGALATMKDDIDKSRIAKEEVDKNISIKMGELKALNDKIAAQKEVLDNLTKNNNSNKETVPELKKRQTDLRAAINENYTKIKALKAEFKAKNDEYFLQLQEEKKRLKEARQKEEEARKAEEEARLKRLEEEELARVPYEEEMQLCDYLVNYLENNFVDKADAPVEKKEASLEIGGGLSLLKREDEEFLPSSTAAKKKGKKKGTNAKKDVIVHGVDTMRSFALLNLNPPGTASGVADSIKQLQDKKAYFQTLERGAIPSIASRRQQQEKKTSATNSSQKTKSVFNLEADFPGLSVEETAAASDAAKTDSN